MGLGRDKNTGDGVGVADIDGKAGSERRGFRLAGGGEADPPAGLGERFHAGGADAAGAAENQDDGRVIGHSLLPSHW